MIHAVIFDLDGTLLNTLDDLAAAVNFALRTCGYPERTTDEVRRFIGNGVVKLMRRAAPKGLDEAAWQTCFAQFRAYYLAHLTDHTVPYDGILPLLESLQAQGVKTAVVSNKLHDGVVDLCADFFGARINAAFGVREESERKPAPVNVFRAMKTLGVSSEETLYAGDSEVDVQTANNAGLRCVGVTWGFRERKELEQAGAWKIIDRPEQLEAVVKLTGRGLIAENADIR